MFYSEWRMGKSVCLTAVIPRKHSTTWEFISLLILCTMLLDTAIGTMRENNFTHWKEIPSNIDSSSVRTIETESNVEFYGGSQTGKIFFLLGRQTLKFTMNCNVEQMNPEYKLKSVKICADYCSHVQMFQQFTGCSHHPCVTLSNSPEQIEFLNLKWDISYDPIYGGNATINITDNALFPNVTLQCIAESVLSKANSSELQLRNYKPFFPKVTHIQNERPVIDPSRPTSFRCVDGNINIKLYRPVNFTWYITKVDSAFIKQNSEARAIRNLLPYKEWPVRILNNGTLHWPFVPNKAVKILENEFLICKIEGFLVGVYKEALVFDKWNGDLSLQPLKPDLSSIQYLQVYASETERVSLDCPVEGGGTGEHSVSWERDGVIFTEGTHSTEGIEIQGETLIINKPFHSSDQRMYTCWASYVPENRSRIGYEVKIEYSLNHIALPNFDNFVPRTLFVLEGQNLDINCTVTDSVEEYFLSVFGDLKFSSKHPLTKVTERRQTGIIYSNETRHYPRNLTLNVVYDIHPPFVYRFYKASQYIFQHNLNANPPYSMEIGGSHSVACGFRPKNGLPIAWRQFVVLVLPSIEYDRYPSEIPCENCDLCLNPHYHCHINVQNKINHHYQLKYAFLWTVISNRGMTLGVEAFPELFYVGNERFKSTLTVLTSDNEEIVENIFGNSNMTTFVLQCRVLIVYKGYYYKQSIYDSNEDEKFKMFLETTIIGRFTSCDLCGSECYAGAAFTLIILLFVFIILAMLISDHCSNIGINKRKGGRRTSHAATIYKRPTIVSHGRKTKVHRSLSSDFSDIYKEQTSRRGTSSEFRSDEDRVLRSISADDLFDGSLLDLSDDFNMIETSSFDISSRKRRLRGRKLKQQTFIEPSNVPKKTPLNPQKVKKTVSYKLPEKTPRSRESKVLANKFTHRMSTLRGDRMLEALKRADHRIPASLDRSSANKKDSLNSIQSANDKCALMTPKRSVRMPAASTHDSLSDVTPKDHARKSVVSTRDSHSSVTPRGHSRTSVASAYDSYSSMIPKRHSRTSVASTRDSYSSSIPRRNSRTSMASTHSQSSIKQKRFSRSSFVKPRDKRSSTAKKRNGRASVVSTRDSRRVSLLSPQDRSRTSILSPQDRGRSSTLSPQDRGRASVLLQRNSRPSMLAPNNHRPSSVSPERRSVITQPRSISVSPRRPDRLVLTPKRVYRSEGTTGGGGNRKRKKLTIKLPTQYKRRDSD